MTTDWVLSKVKLSWMKLEEFAEILLEDSFVSGKYFH